MTEGIEDALPLPLSMAAPTLSVLPQFNLTTNHPIRYQKRNMAIIRLCT